MWEAFRVGRNRNHGESAYKLLDWMKAAGLRYWQMLPICEGDPVVHPIRAPQAWWEVPGWLI